MTTLVADSIMARTKAVLPMTISEKGSRASNICPMSFIGVLRDGNVGLAEKCESLWGSNNNGVWEGG